MDVVPSTSKRPSQTSFYLLSYIPHFLGSFLARYIPPPTAPLFLGFDPFFLVRSVGCVSPLHLFLDLALVAIGRNLRNGNISMRVRLLNSQMEWIWNKTGLVFVSFFVSFLLCFFGFFGGVVRVSGGFIR